MNATAPAADLAAAIAAALDPAAIAAAVAGQTAPPAQEAAPAFALVSPDMPKPRAPRVDAWTADHAAELSAAIRSGSLARQLAQTNAAAPCAFQLELFAPAGQMNLFTDTTPAPEPTPPPNEPKPERRAPETKPEPQPAKPSEPPAQQGRESLAGKVIVSSFHYSMTFHDFFGVIRDTGKSLSLIELEKETGQENGFMQARVRPIPDPQSPFGYRIKAGAKPINRRPNERGGFQTKPSHYSNRTKIYDPAKTYTEDYAD